MAAAKVSVSLPLGLVLAFLILASAPGRAGEAIPTPLQAADDWAMYGSSPAHTFANTAAPPAALGLVWSLSANAALDGASAVESDGFVYIADFDSTPPPSGPQLRVYKVVEGNGSFFGGWSTLINVVQRSSISDSVARGVPRSLAVSSDLVFVLFTAGNASANRETVVALDVATGAHAWTFNGTEPWTSPTPQATRSAPILGGGILAFGSQDGNVYALNPSTGSPLWWVPSGTSVQTVPAIVEDIVYATSGTRLWYLDVQGRGDGLQGDPDPNGTGDLLFSVETGAAILTSPIVSGPYVYVDVAGDLWAVDRLAAGVPLWVQATPHESAATPAVATNLIVTRRSDGRLYAYDATSGQVEWVRAGLLSAGSGGDVAIADGRVFLTAKNGTTYDLVALDAADGTIQFRDTTAGRPSLGSTVVAGGKVLVTEGASLRAFRGQPDLAPDKVVMSSGTIAGNFARANVTVTVRNLGTEPVSSVRVRVYDGDPGGAGVLIGEVTIGAPLAPNGLSTLRTADRNWTLGQHDVWVVIDRAAAETNEANNVRSFPIYVQAGPPRNPVVLGAGPYALALLAGFGIGFLVFWFPLRRLTTLRRKETEK